MTIIISFNGIQVTVQEKEVVKLVRKEKYFKPYNSSDKTEKDLKNYFNTHFTIS